ncbi:MAG: polysaccharide deacetylase family protein [Clostridiaceae bacterium]|nr:polysaccharide deacetylase family protein [Clostridiaceae bacterium]
MRRSKTFTVILSAVVVSLVLIFFINRRNNKEPDVPPLSTTAVTTTTVAQHTETSDTVGTTQPAEPTQPASPATTTQGQTSTEEVKDPVDYSVIRPNESGEIPIVMFHNFIEDLNSTNDIEWTTSFDEFEKLLETLYESDYRLISMRDFIDHNIDVPAGKIPMVFTFDDGTPGQYNLIEVNGKLEVNPKSAVGVMLKFHEKHPDFGLKGIFYLNMDKENKTFEGAGTLKERLEILLSYGFEVGNHTWGHKSLETVTSKAELNERLGKNEKYLNELMDGLKFYSLALPHGGKAPEDLSDYLVKGMYEGVQYHNESIMAVGYLPSVPSIHVDYNPAYVRRIRSQGKVETRFDLTYWLPLMTRDRMYISDGDPDTVVVPERKKGNISIEKLNGKELITY